MVLEAFPGGSCPPSQQERALSLAFLKTTGLWTWFPRVDDEMDPHPLSPVSLLSRAPLWVF